MKAIQSLIIKKKWFYFLKFHYLDIYSFYVLSEVEGLYNHGQGKACRYYFFI